MRRFPAADGSAMLARNGRQIMALLVAPTGASFASEATPQEPQPHKSNAGYRRLIAKIAAPVGKSAITIRLEPCLGKSSDTVEHQSAENHH
jgi:hypothetical protein